MKSLLIFLTTFLFLTTNIHSQFRKTTWGMSPQEVEAVETAKFVDKNETFYMYEGNVGGLDDNIVYQFAKNKLVGAASKFSVTHSNKTEFINDYNDLKDILIKKYGKPDEDEKFWYDDLFKDHPQDWGMAIATGDLAYQSIWEDKKNKILLLLKGDNYEVELSITYKSVELQYLLEEEKKAKNTDDF
jgi:hypothetical protein